MPPDTFAFIAIVILGFGLGTAIVVALKGKADAEKYLNKEPPKDL